MIAGCFFKKQLCAEELCPWTRNSWVLDHLFRAFPLGSFVFLLRRLNHCNPFRGYRSILALRLQSSGGKRPPLLQLENTSHTENKEKDSKESSSNTPGRRKIWSWPYLAELVLGKDSGPCPLQVKAPSRWLENPANRITQDQRLSLFCMVAPTAAGGVKRGSPGATREDQGSSLTGAS